MKPSASRHSAWLAVLTGFGILLMHALPLQVDAASPQQSRRIVGAIYQADSGHHPVGSETKSQHDGHRQPPDRDEHHMLAPCVAVMQSAGVTHPHPPLGHPTVDPLLGLTPVLARGGRSRASTRASPAPPDLHALCISRT